MAEWSEHNYVAACLRARDNNVNGNGACTFAKLQVRDDGKAILTLDTVRGHDKNRRSW